LAASPNKADSKQVPVHSKFQLALLSHEATAVAVGLRLAWVVLGSMELLILLQHSTAASEAATAAATLKTTAETIGKISAASC